MVADFRIQIICLMFSLHTQISSYKQCVCVYTYIYVYICTYTYSHAFHNVLVIDESHL